MLLKKEKKTECLAKISDELPTLLNEAGINISLSSRNELTQLIQKQVEYKFFPSVTVLFIEMLSFSLLLPFSLLKAFLPNAVLITKNCTNTELTQISLDKIKKLDQLITDKILNQYRDYATEERYAIEARTRSITTARRQISSTEHLATTRPRNSTAELQNLVSPKLSLSSPRSLYFSEESSFSNSRPSSTAHGKQQQTPSSSSYGHYEQLVRSYGITENMSPEATGIIRTAKKYDSYYCTIL